MRQGLGRQICLQYADEGKILKILTLAPTLEQKIIDSRSETARGFIAALEPSLHRQWITALTNSVKMVQDQGHTPIILCSEAARSLVKSSSLREIPHLVVISIPEVAAEINIESLGEIRLEE
ncbi:unnamed protein product [marine sediment metagenome]|uniref:Uncharacterized protein n=1 Tax=marine sediment metagenome TaxID=412755 RepID=X0YCQ2_9ZZZZ